MNIHDVQLVSVPEQVGSSMYAVDSSPTCRPPNVVLTFDDGPRRGDTDLIAAELARFEAHATFFTLLVRARADRHVLTELAAAGHDIALHGVDHRRLTYGDPQSIAATLRDAADELSDLSGVSVDYFRPPYGAQNPQVWAGARDAGLIPVLWQRECREWDATAPLSAFDELHDLPQGAVILAHDTSATPADGAEPMDSPHVDRRAFAAEVLERIAGQGLVATSLTRALRHGEPRWRVWLDAPVNGGVT